MTGGERIPLIDSHTHCGTEQEVGVLTGVMDELKLKACMVCAICYGAGDQTISTPLALLLKLSRPGQIYASGGLFYKLPGQRKMNLDLPGQAAKLMSLGFDGMKMLQGKPTAYREIGIPMNAPVYDEYYAFLQAERIPVVFHVADPEEFWDRTKIPAHFLEMGWCYDDGTYPAKEQLYGEIDDVLDRFPELRIVFAHFYFLSADMERAARFLDRRPTVSFDITPGMEMYGNFSARADQWSDFFTRYKDRLVFGTDNVCPVDEGSLAMAVEKIRCMRRFLATRDEFVFDGYKCRGLGLGADVLESIFHLNFERYFGARPRDVNVASALAYCKELAAIANRMDDGAKIASSLESIARKISRLAG